MPEAGTAMSATTKNADLVNKITFLQNCIFTVCYEGISFSYDRSSTKVNAYFFTGQVPPSSRLERDYGEKSKYTLTIINPLFIMKYLLIVLMLPFLSASECGKKKNNKTADNTETVKDSIPVCVRKMIDAANKETPPDAPEKIDEYVYNGKTVYLFMAQCCDQFNVLYDDSCKMICSPSGGITGRGDRKCEDFSKNAKHIKQIWTNSVK